MAEKPKVKVKDVTVPGQAGKSMIDSLSEALGGVIETMNGGKTVVKKGKGK